MIELLLFDGGSGRLRNTLEKDSFHVAPRFLQLRTPGRRYTKALKIPLLGTIRLVAVAANTAGPLANNSDVSCNPSDDDVVTMPNMTIVVKMQKYGTLYSMHCVLISRNRLIRCSLINSLENWNLLLSIFFCRTVQ